MGIKRVLGMNLAILLKEATKDPLYCVMSQQVLEQRREECNGGVDLRY